MAEEEYDLDADFEKEPEWDSEDSTAYAAWLEAKENGTLSPDSEWDGRMVTPFTDAELAEPWTVNGAEVPLRDILRQADGFSQLPDLPKVDLTAAWRMDHLPETCTDQECPEAS